MMLPLAAIALVWHVIIVFWLVIAVGLILVVLLQKGRGGGLAGAFGGAGTSSLLGTKTGDFLTWLTIGLVALFLSLSVVMGLYMRPLPSSELTMPSAPTAPAASTEQPAAPTETAPAAGNTAPAQPAQATPAKPAQEAPAQPAAATPTPTQPAGTPAPKQ
jgi:preprotein translocase subunit SecG